MRASRALVLIVLFAVAVAAAWWFTARPRPSPPAETVTVYYPKADGTTLVPWAITLDPHRDRSDRAKDRNSTIFYAATQCVAGPPPGTQAVRFPDGTHVLALDVEGSTVDVDISKEIASSAEGGFAESAEFKALVWTLTQPAFGVDAVKVRIGGARVATLPGGHLELDEPLSRSSF
jgi:spore germination protein GerM